MVRWTIAWTALAVAVTFLARAIGQGLVDRLWTLRHATLALVEQGDLAEVPDIRRRDEIGGMARVLRVFRDKTRLLRERNGQLLREAVLLEVRQRAGASVKRDPVMLAVPSRVSRC